MTTTLTRGFDRRSLLKATGVVGLAVGGLAYVPTAALAAGSSVTTNAAGATLRALAGTNIYRDTNSLVRYTRTSTQTVTPTNQYGVEVTVSSSTNKVTAVNNRLSSGSTAGTAIPAGSYILSGHGYGTGSAGQWLLNFATVGKLVTLNAAGPAPVPAPSPDAQGVTTNATGATVHALAGTNISRDANSLVRYTRTSTQTVTPTNQYGVEVTVSSTTNKVTALSNRLASGGTAGTPIPAGSYVLSGHDLGTGKAGQWLLNFATVGKLVTLNAAGPVPAPVPAPVPDPEPQPQPSGGALAASVVSMWHHAWSGPQPWTGYPIGARSQVNHVVLGLAQSGGSGTGKLSYYNRFGAGLRTSVVAAKAAGCTVVMGFGGSSDGGIAITNSTQADQAFDSIVGFVKSYGINGIDVDLEPSGSSWTPAALVRLCTRLKTTYGADFIVGLTPAFYGEHTAKWMAVAKALGSKFDYMAPMLYDFPEANQSNYGAVCVAKCDIMAAAGIPQSKWILGFMMKPPAENYPNASDSWQKTRTAYNAVKAKYPNLRGAFMWEDKIMAARQWDWALNMGPVIKA